MCGHSSGRTRGDLRAAHSYLRRFQWQGLLRFGPFRWSDVAPWRAARVAVGVVVPLAVGLAGGHLEYGVYASLGALPAGFVTFQGVTRTRVAAVVAASVGMAVSTFVGGTTAAFAPWLSVPVVIVWGYVTGLAVCLGPRPSVAVNQWAVALLIAFGMPLGPPEAALRAGLVIAGGLFQGVLVLFQAALVGVSWALQRGDPERAALSDSFRYLATYASELATDRAGPPPPVAFPATVRLGDPSPLLPMRVLLAYFDLLELAERIRAGLAALGDHADGETTRSASRFAADIGQVLEAIARALAAGRGNRAGRVGELERLVTSLKAPTGTDWSWVAEALLGLLRDVTGILVRVDKGPARTPTGAASNGSVAPLPEAGIEWQALALRANLTPAGETGRHAVRLAVVAGLAETIVQATGPFEGRWMVLTIFLVLKPDFNSTVYRSIHRALGTAVGAGLGAAAAELARSDQAGLVIAATVALAAAYALFDVNYLLYSCLLTVFLVILLEILGLPAAATAQARLTETAVGGALAIVAYSLWPTWEGLTAQEKFARAVEAHGQYASALLREAAHPGRATSARLRALQATARRARTDAEASTARLADEPPSPPLTPVVAQTLVAAVTRIAHAELSLHALVTSPAAAAYRKGGRGTDAGTQRLEALGIAVGSTMTTLADAIRSQQPPGNPHSLGRLYTKMRDRPPPLEPVPVNITDSLVYAIDTLEVVLRSTRPAG